MCFCLEDRVDGEKSLIGGKRAEGDIAGGNGSLHGGLSARRPATSDVTGVNVGIRSAANLFAAEFEAAMEARSIGKNEFHTPGPGEVLFSTLIKGSSVWFGL